MAEKHYTDNDVKNAVHKIIRGMETDNWSPDYIVGLTRGGLVPALYLSHYLNIPMETLKISLRDGGTETNTWMPLDAANGKRILIVDDINDTGATLNYLLDDWLASANATIKWGADVRVAVLVDNLSSNYQFEVEYCGDEINKLIKSEWIIFPWENWWENRP